MSNLKFAHIEYSMDTKSIDIFNIGCDARPKCEGCCNSEIWDWNSSGYDVNYVCDQIQKLTKQFDKLVTRFILVGGDPVDAYIRYPEEYTDLLFCLCELYKPVYLFTRHDLKDIPIDLIKMVDYIKTGAYIPELTCDDNIQYDIKLATNNQKIYSVEVLIQDGTIKL